MAKKVKKDSKQKAAERKAKNSKAINNYELINDFDGVRTEVLKIRNHGCIVRETTEQGHVSSIFVADIKTKKKGVNQVLVMETQEIRDAKKEKRDARKSKAKKSK